MVADYEENKVLFKDNPTEWHKLPTTEKGLMMIPLTKEACDRHVPPEIPSPPEPVTDILKQKRAHRKKRRHAIPLRAKIADPLSEGPARSSVYLKAPL